MKQGNRVKLLDITDELHRRIENNALSRCISQIEEKVNTIAIC